MHQESLAARLPDGQANKGVWQAGCLTVRPTSSPLKMLSDLYGLLCSNVYIYVQPSLIKDSSLCSYPVLLQSRASECVSDS